MAYAELAPGSSILHYKILDRIGAGGMGVVWRAIDTRLEREVALKVLQPDSIGDVQNRARFLLEAKAASALAHPNIVTIYEVNSEDGVDVIAMEYVQGRTLAEILRDGPLAPADALRYAIQISDGIGRAHRKGIIHRDLKPSNVMIGADDLVKVLDFGLAKLWEAPRPVSEPEQTQTMQSPITVPGMAAGTPSYMSPEQAIGRQLDARSDVFSLGILLYEMFSGRRPFEGGSSLEVMMDIVKTQPPELTQLAPRTPPAIARIVGRCLMKDPESRFPDAGALHLELRKLDSELASATIRHALTLEASAVPFWRRRGIMTVACLALVAAAALGIPSSRRWIFAELGAVSGSQEQQLALGHSGWADYRSALALLERYDLKGNVDTAIRQLERALEVEPGYAAAYAGLAEAYLLKFVGSPDRQWLNQARESGRKAVELNRDLAVAHASLGMALAESGAYAESGPELQKALDLDPLNWKATLAVAKVTAASDKTADAEPLFRKAIEIGKDHWWPHAELALYRFRRADYAGALQEWNLALRITPDNANVLRSLGATYHMVDRDDEAAAAFQRALEIAPTAGTFANLGTARYFQGRYLDAVSPMEKAVQLMPTQYLYWGNLGDAYRWAPGYAAKAKAAYLRAIQLVRERIAAKPNDPELMSSLAAYLAKSGERQAAIGTVSDVEALARKTPGALFRCALAEELSGNREKAFYFLDAALKAGYSTREVRNEPEFAALRADIHYASLISAYLSKGSGSTGK
ncbi:MAG: serine/threonine protein kinase with repeat [Bryobacterales bacterium]|nr:serine/threonine protein kinase with repeat [Bryobacterales bacterium]